MLLVPYVNSPVTIKREAHIEVLMVGKSKPNRLYLFAIRAKRDKVALVQEEVFNPDCLFVGPANRLPFVESHS
jgi:hypothetical protein